MGVTSTFAGFVVDLDFETLDPRLINLLKRQLADTVGVALAGAETRAASIAKATVGSTGASTIWAANAQASPSDSAYVNGVSAHALDFDDTWILGSHPSAPVIPAILAQAEASEVSGRRVLEALAGGYEIYARLSGAVPFRRGWHPTGVMGAFGAAAGVAKVMGFSEGDVRTTFGIAASMTGGIDGQEGTMTKALHAGVASRTGVLAADLTSRGFTSNTSVFDGSPSFFDAFYPGVEKASWVLTGGLGSYFMVQGLGIGIKMHAAGYYLHQPFEAALEIVEANDLVAADIELIEIQIAPDSPFNRPRVTVGLEGKFSVQYVVCLAVLKRRLSAECFTDEIALSNEMQALIERTSVVLNSDLTRNPDLRSNPVTITSQTGGKWTCDKPVPSSHWRYPLPEEVWKGKFKTNVTQASGYDADQILDVIERLEDVPRVNELCELLA